MKLGYKFVSEFIDSFPKRTSEKLINKRGALVVGQCFTFGALCI